MRKCQLILVLLIERLNELRGVVSSPPGPKGRQRQAEAGKARPNEGSDLGKQNKNHLTAKIPEAHHAPQSIASTVQKSCKPHALSHPLLRPIDLSRRFPGRSAGTTQPKRKQRALSTCKLRWSSQMTGSVRSPTAGHHSAVKSLSLPPKLFREKSLGCNQGRPELR